MLARQRLILILLLPLSWAAMYLLSSLAPPLIIDYNPMSPWMVLAGDVPLFVAALFAWQYEKPTVEFFQPELLGLFAIWISLINGYIVAYLLPLLNVLPSPVASPANQLDLPVNYLAVALILGVTLFFIWFLFRPGGLARRADQIYLPHRRITLLLSFTLLVLLVNLLGGTDLGFALLPSAWTWLFILPRADRRGKLLNITLAIAGMVYPLAFGGIALWQGTWWRAVLAAAYNILTPVEVALFLFWMALFVRFLRLGLSKPYVAPLEPDNPLFQLIKSR